MATKTDAKILIFDIETTHLKADFGTMLSFGYKWLGDKYPTVLSIMDYKGWKNDPTDDSKLARDAYKILEQADMFVTYFGKGFDVKYLNAKMLEHGLPIIPNTAHVDLFYTVKANLALSRKSLGNVGYFLGLNAEKTPVEGRIWKKAMVGDQDSIRYVIEHNAADVDLLEEAYLKLRPLVRQHPRVSTIDECRACGSDKVQRRGYSVSVLRGPQYRIKCTECGHWETRAVPKAEQEAS